MANHLILNIPHASATVPEEDIMRVFLPHVTASSYIQWKFDPLKSKLIQQRSRMIQQELLAMTDWYTDDLFDQGFGSPVIAKVSRLVCDTERFMYDELEPMSEKGMGLCYVLGSRGQKIKDFSPSYRDEILMRYYAPHHVALEDAVTASLLDNRFALILDCHSFSPVPLKCEQDKRQPRPDICIGTDSFHTSRALEDLAVSFFRSKGLIVESNSPFSGSMVPVRYYRKDPRVQSLMVEINRKLYLERGTNRKNSNYRNLKKTIAEFENLLCSFKP